jgi:hypothetical protein
MAGEELNKKLAEAREALAGSEWTAKQQRDSKNQTLLAEQAELATKLAAITKQKEALELAWIELDNGRKGVHQVLDPILAEEKKVEEEEAKLEAEEAKIGLPVEKHAVEEKRWAVADERKAVEQKKWGEEEKLVKVDKVIGDNTAEYRKLLDEEDKITTRLEQIKTELAL